MSREAEEKAKRALEPILDNPIVKMILVEVLALLLRAVKEWVDNDVEG